MMEKDCQQCLELLPWYVNGSLPATFSLAIKGTNYGSGFFTGTLILQAQAI